MPGTDLLDDFMKLASAPDEQILTFAKRWGVLDLCRHGLPTGHVPHPLLVSMDHGGRRLCSPLAPDDVDPLSVDFARLEGLEPLKYWRMWAKRARALMRIAATLKSLKPGAVADWKDFFDNEWLLPDGRPHKTKILGSLGKSHVMDQDFLCTLLNHWIMTGQVAPMLVRRGNGPVVIRFSCGLTARLFGTIGLQMLVRVSGVGSMAICAACGILFKPDRAPSPARLSFCQKCGRKAAVRLAKQRLNSRKLQALEMHGRGEPVATIARTVHSRPSTVLGWLKEKGA